MQRLALALLRLRKPLFVHSFVVLLCNSFVSSPVFYSFEPVANSATNGTLHLRSFLPVLQICMPPISLDGFFLGWTTIRARTSSSSSTFCRSFPTRRFVRLDSLVAGAGARRRTWTCGRASSRRGRRPWLVGDALDQLPRRLGTILWILVDGHGRACRPWRPPPQHKRRLRRRTWRTHACAWRRAPRSRSVRRGLLSRPRLAAAPGRRRARGSAARGRTWPRARRVRRRPAAPRLLLPRPSARVLLRHASFRRGSRIEARRVRVVASRNVSCTATTRRSPCAPRHAFARVPRARHVGQSVARWHGRTRPVAAASTLSRSATTRVDAHGVDAWLPCDGHVASTVQVGGEEDRTIVEDECFA